MNCSTLSDLLDTVNAINLVSVNTILCSLCEHHLFVLLEIVTDWNGSKYVNRLREKGKITANLLV